MQWLLLAILYLTGCSLPQPELARPVKGYVSDLNGHTRPCYVIKCDGDIIYCRSEWPNEDIVFNRATKGVYFIEFNKALEE